MNPPRLKHCEVKLTQFTLKAKLTQHELTLLITHQSYPTPLTTTLIRSALSRELRNSILSIDNAYAFLKELAKHPDEESDAIALIGNELLITVPQEVAGVSVVRQAKIPLDPIEPDVAQEDWNQVSAKKKQALRSFSLASEGNLSDILEDDLEFSRLSQTSMKEKGVIRAEELAIVDIRLGEITSRLTGLESTLARQRVQEFGDRLRVVERKQEYIVNKIMNIEEKLFVLHSDKKEVRKMFECSVDELWEQVKKITQKIDEIPLKSSEDHSSNPFQLRVFEQQQRSSVGGEVAEDRNSMPEQALAMSQGELWKTMSDSSQKGGNVNVNEKLMQIERKLQGYISPRPLQPRFKVSPYGNKFKFEETERGRSYTITKKAVDKQYQLIGEAIPDQGKFYFRVKLITVPHGYVHLGVISKQGELEQSSVTSQNCINYFGGNGSLNNRGDGVLIGKQLQQADVVTVLIDMDNGVIRFLLRSHLLAQADLKEMDLEVGLLPFVQLFYGNSKILILND